MSSGWTVICLFRPFITFHVTVLLNLEGLLDQRDVLSPYTFPVPQTKPASPRCATGSMTLAFPCMLWGFLTCKFGEKVFLKKFISLDVNFEVGFGNLAWLLSL